MSRDCQRRSGVPVEPLVSFSFRSATPGLLGDEGVRIVPHRLLGEDRPVFQQLPRRAVALAAPLGPMISVERHGRRGVVEQRGQLFALEALPARTIPGVALERLLDLRLRFAAVAQCLQLVAVKAGRHRFERRRQPGVDLDQHVGTHPGGSAPRKRGWRPGTAPPTSEAPRPVPLFGHVRGLSTTAGRPDLVPPADA